MPKQLTGSVRIPFAAVILMVMGVLNMVEAGERSVPLRELAAKHHLLIGVAVNTKAFSESSGHAQYMAVLEREFSIITAENAMKFGSLSPKPGEYDWTTADAMFEFARKHQMKVRFHTGLWHTQVPQWLKEDQYTPEQITAIAKAHIQTVGKRYGGEMTYWDVVNEPIELKDPDGLRNTIWKKAIGDDYLEQVYRWAHDAAPKAKLVINDYGADVINGKSDRLYQLIKDFKERGVPVHAVGLQMHLMDGEGHSREKLAANFQRFADLGVEVHVTEMDVGTAKFKGTIDEKLANQANVYRTVIQALLDVKGTVVFQTWGFTDNYTWLRSKEWNGPEDRPLLFDEQYQPKPAYHAIAEALRTPQADKPKPITLP